MKQIVSQYAAYNLWANNIFIEYIKKLNIEQQQAFAASSFPSLYNTIVHMWQTERNWLKRLQLDEGFAPTTEEVNLSFNEVGNN